MQRALVSVTALLIVTAACAEPLEIVGFDHSGTIEFQGATVSNYYTLEFAPAVSGPWTNWGSLTEQPITNAVSAKCCSILRMIVSRAPARRNRRGGRTIRRLECAKAGKTLSRTNGLADARTESL